VNNKLITLNTVVCTDSKINNRNKKSFRDRELINSCAIKVANTFSGSKIAEKFKTASLSHQTISGQINEIADNVSDTLCCHE
jgi:hypothetical protein